MTHSCRWPTGMMLLMECPARRGIHRAWRMRPRYARGPPDVSVGTAERDAPSLRYRVVGRRTGYFFTRQRWKDGQSTEPDLRRCDVKPSVIYRVASVLLVLFAIGHTFGFRQSDSGWGVSALLALMQSVHFDLQGFSRTYWNLYSGLGFFVTVFLLFSAVLALQLGGLPEETLSRVRGIAWALALSFCALTLLSWRYL